MICDIEVNRILTKTNGLVEERSASGLTTNKNNMTYTDWLNS